MPNNTTSTALCAALALACGTLSQLRADLVPLGIWNGNVGLSIDAVGSNNSPVGNIQAEIPAGATILAAYLYSAGLPFPFPNAPTTLAEYNNAGITLAGQSITNFTELVGTQGPDAGWYTARADVTELVRELATGGPNYSWSVTEGSGSNALIDGELLAIVYSHASLPEGSVVLLDGGQNTAGETTTISFANPLGNVNDPAFFAEMSLGISFSTGGDQVSTVDINGQRLTSAAGGFDDGVLINGGLITAGGIGDSLSNPTNPFSSTADDDELYNLVPFLTTGDTSLSIFTSNPSNDDNIFFMGLRIATNISSVNEPDPDPVGVPDGGTTVVLLGAGFLTMTGMRRWLGRS